MAADTNAEAAIAGKVDRELEQAWQLANTGAFEDVREANRILFSTLNTTRYKRYFEKHPDKKAYISELMDSYRKEHFKLRREREPGKQEGS